jgi:hypothetical protein
VGDLSEAVSLGLVMVVGNWGGEGEGSGVEDEDAKLGSANSVLVELGGLLCCVLCAMGLSEIRVHSRQKGQFSILGLIAFS